MALDISLRDDIRLPEEWLPLMDRLWRFFCDQEDVPCEAIVDLTFCNDAQIQEINREHRGVDAPTDVLSFPMFEPDEPIVSMAGEELLFGDILISYPRLFDQAAEYGHSSEREALYLIAHGLLHLAGYDHMEEEEWAQMRIQEEKLMQALGLSREEAVDFTALEDCARQAAQAAYAPYSNFPVGAALLGANGRIYQGCNVENASYGLTSCAERNAVFAAIADGCREFKALALAAGNKTPAQPCGACRQVLAEFAPELPILLSNLDGSQRSEHNLGELFPAAFRLQEEEEE